MLAGDRAGKLAFRASSLKQAEQIDPEADYIHPRPTKTRWSISRSGSVWTTVVLAVVCLLLLYIASQREETDPLSRRNPSETKAGPSAIGPVLVSYSYFEKDAVQLANAEFFWKVGIGLHSSYAAPKDTDFVVVVSGEACTPCAKLRPLLAADPLLQRFSTLREAHSAKGLTLLLRNVNEGMDFAAHNVSFRLHALTIAYGWPEAATPCLAAQRR